jgi:aryl-alcohol dehydrogenase-like predicted oxidoreductase
VPPLSRPPDETRTPAGDRTRYTQLAVNAEPQHVRACVEASMRRPQTDHIDLLYPHFPDPCVPIEDTVGAMAELVDAGIVRHVGLSNVTAEHLRAALAAHPIAAVQVEWSMWHPIHPAVQLDCSATSE